MIGSNREFPGLWNSKFIKFKSILATGWQMIPHATVHRVTPTAKTVQMGKMIVLFNTPDSALIVMRIQLWIKSVSIVVLVNRSSVKSVQALI